MAYDFIGLVNDVNSRLNEVQLTTDNFTTVTGFFAFAKEAVNSSIRHIQQEEYEWPWNHVENEETLTALEPRYSYPNDAKTINMNSFRIKRDDTLNVGTVKLKNMTYEEYLEKYADAEYNTQTKSVPTHIVRAPNRELICYPMPDKAYEMVYEYYRVGYDLISATDVPSLPEQYRFVIVDGAMHYAYQFRGDTPNATAALQKFEQGIKHLRSININRTDYLRDTRVHF
jgi:hypothetical protein